jgi:hypothetical protein
LHINSSKDNTIVDLACADYSNYGVHLQGTSPGNRFTGRFMVGSIYGVPCRVDAETAAGDLMDDTDGEDDTHSGECLPTGISDFEATSIATLTSTFVGKIATDDTANGDDDTDGGATYPVDPADFDWVNFDNNYRGWGKEGNAFPHTNNRDQWTTGEGHIWDWRLVSEDTVLLDALDQPADGNAANTITHTWHSSDEPANQDDCDVDASGSTFVAATPNRCDSTYLRHAVELVGDGYGNEVGLCQSNEACRYTPNIGAYQGHGPLISTGSISSGDTITGVTLQRFTTNGI